MSGRLQSSRAEGEKQSKILRAEGEGEAIITVFRSIHEGKPSRELLTYQYIQALPQVAAGEGVTLMIVPSDAMAAMGAVAALGGGFQTAQDAAGTSST